MGKEEAMMQVEDAETQIGVSNNAQKYYQAFKE
jgi:hypothetical protein